MPVIRDNRVEDDPRRHGPDRIGVQSVAAAQAPGLVLEPDVDLEAIAARLHGVDAIEIRFPAHSDGRGFSLARRLRRHYGFGGELVAGGRLIADQFAAALQCGFDAVRVDEEIFRRQPYESWRNALDRFDHAYQRHHSGGASRRTSILDARHARRRAATASAYTGLSAVEALERAIGTDFSGRIALTTSFGVDSAVLLHLVSTIDRSTPVFFIDTSKHFAETLAYGDSLVKRFGLTGFQALSPDAEDVAARDPDGTLWARDHDACCDLRKVRPMHPVNARFDVIITGRKRYQTRARSALPVLERAAGQTRLNPLAAWTPQDLTRYIRDHDLPPHPLLTAGLGSIGCAPCTTPVDAAEDPRAGRWRNSAKTECGIHFAASSIT